MKITITPEFQAQYDDLFLEIQGLVNDSVEVNDIPSYFLAIEEYREKNPGMTLPPKFLRLPLEEPAFEVDMDKRTISVPPEFKENGLGVKGDANAEIVIFHLASRWFEAMDLNLMRCYIEWTNTATKENGASMSVLQDVADDEMYIGWLITDKMTSTPGNIEFALRFTDYQNGNISYNISTQRAVCAIKPTLNLDLNAVEIDDEGNSIVLNRPIYSNVINSMDGASPNITVNLDSKAEYNLDPTLIGLGGKYEAYAEQYPDGLLELKVEANSPDGGEIQYRWYKNKSVDAYDVVPENNEDNVLVVGEAGVYYATIGNKTESNLRVVTSGQANIPAASNIVEGEKNFPLRMYSPKQEEQENAPELVYNAEGNNGKLIYTWKLDDVVLTEDDGVNENTYHPQKNVEGKVTCSIVNRKNNTVSSAIETKPGCELRAIPAPPKSVEATWDSANSQLKAVASYNYLEGEEYYNHPSANHPDEWRYQWTYTKTRPGVDGVESGSVPNAQGGNSAIAKPVMTPNATYKFTCLVWHSVWHNDTTGMRQDSAQVDSNTITLNVDATGKATH